MGMKYHMECLDCLEFDKEDHPVLPKPKSDEIEFSIVDHISVKDPDNAKEKFIEWIEFLNSHSGHRITLVDAKGKQTDPSKITGKYVLGLTDNPY